MLSMYLFSNTYSSYDLTEHQALLLTITLEKDTYRKIKTMNQKESNLAILERYFIYVEILESTYGFAIACLTGELMSALIHLVKFLFALWRFSIINTPTEKPVKPDKKDDDDQRGAPRA